MTTDAYRGLEARLAEVALLSGLDPTRTQGIAGDRATANAVNRAACVLVIAHLEGYCKDILQQAMDTFEAEGVPFVRLPMAMRETQARSRIREIASTKDDTERRNKTSALFEKCQHLWAGDSAVNQRDLSARTLQRELTNAKPKGLRRIFPLLDLPDLFDGHLTRTDFAGRLQTLVERRDQIAHGNLDEAPTWTEVDEARQMVLDLAREMDERFEAAIAVICGKLGTELPGPAA